MGLNGSSHSYWLTCDLCGKKVTRLHRRTRHNREIGWETAVWICDECNSRNARPIEIRAAYADDREDA